MKKKIDKILAIDFETANNHKTSACSVGLAFFDYNTGELIERRHQLINPHEQFFYNNTLIHSIKEADVAGAPSFAEVFPSIIDLIRQSTIVVAHNASFDIGVLTQCAEKANLPFEPFDFMCTLCLSRQILPDIENHKLNTVANILSLGGFQHHRADEDAEICGRIFLKLAKVLDAVYIKDIITNAHIHKGYAYAYGYESCRAHGQSSIYGKVRKLPTNTSSIDNLFDGKSLVFTGVFNSMSRNDAERLAIEHGGCVAPGVSKKIDYLIYGVQDLRATKGHEKSSKQIKAEELVAKGFPITILSETEYLELTHCSADDMQTYQIIFEHVENIISQNQDQKNKPFQYDQSTYTMPKGYDQYWKGEQCRLAGDYEQARRLFEDSKQLGYDAPVLYLSFAMLYRKLGDYESELAILQEGIEHSCNPRQLLERQEKTRQLIQRKLQAAEKEAEKRKLAEEKALKKLLQAKEHQVKIKPVQWILQLDDTRNIICKYPSFSEAARQTGINVKCIRDAACGKQKHAGNYCWAIKVQDNQE